jgi:hypothetical protein
MKNFTISSITLIVGVYLISSSTLLAQGSRIEQATPPGSVPPPRANERPLVVEREQGYIGSKAIAPQPRFESDRSAMSAFADAYKRAKSPRIAIYFNRTLSDRITEWVGTERTLKSVQYEGRVTNPISHDGKRQTSGKSDAMGSITSTREEQIAVGAGGGRSDPSERWAWEFEDAVVNQFLDQRVNVVDRALMLRTMASKSSKDSIPISTTSNEAEALQKFTDILVEILVTRSSRSPLGYDFRATAKNIRTQTIVASTFVDGTTNPNPVTDRYINDSNGYRKIQEQAPLQIEDVARQLSVGLMRSLTSRL